MTTQTAELESYSGRGEEYASSGFSWTWRNSAGRFLPGEYLFAGLVPVTLYDWTQPQKGRLRIFKSDFLEALTVVHPAMPLAIWLPASAWLLWGGAMRGFGAEAMASLFVGGLFFWTFFEYAMHRTVFHFVPRSRWQVVLAYFMHGVHHAFPDDDRRLVMPPALALILFVPVYLGFRAFLGGLYQPALSGFLIGYLCYDMTHYSVHAMPMTSRFGNLVRKHHMLHHYASPDKRFGVSTPLWDLVFGTYE